MYALVGTNKLSNRFHTVVCLLAFVTVCIWNHGFYTVFVSPIADTETVGFFTVFMRKHGLFAVLIWNHGFFTVLLLFTLLIILTIIQ